MSFLKRIWKKLFGPKRPAVNLKYDTTQVEHADGRVTLTEQGKAQRKTILTTELKENDTYQLGPEATVTVAPEGTAGKKWVAARIAASEKRRQAKFDAWWEAKRERCTAIMMMTPEELESSGVKAEVEAFLAQNEQMKVWLAGAGQKQPSGLASERTEEAFKELLRISGNQQMVSDGFATERGELVPVTPESVERYKLLYGEKKS